MALAELEADGREDGGKKEAGNQPADSPGFRGGKSGGSGVGKIWGSFRSRFGRERCCGFRDSGRGCRGFGRGNWRGFLHQLSHRRWLWDRLRKRSCGGFRGCRSGCWHDGGQRRGGGRRRGKPGRKSARRIRADDFLPAFRTGSLKAGRGGRHGEHGAASRAVEADRSGGGRFRVHE